MVNLQMAGKLNIFKYLTILGICIVCINSVFAQSKYITAGIIEYERKFNQYAFLSDETKPGESESEWIAQMKKELPKTVSDNYVLIFNENQSVYKLKNENPDNKYMWGMKPAENDVVAKNMLSNTLQLQREVFENNYLITDSLKKYVWKLTNEVREIAGYDCKKAITKICDSVYVVAFYTEDIAISNGPESFVGLPGMILGVAVPRLYTTWFATKVEVREPTQQELLVKFKGTKSTYAAAVKEMLQAMKDWGNYGFKKVWSFTL